MIDARIALERAQWRAHSLKGELRSKVKQADYGTPSSSRIALACIPSIERRIAEAEDEVHRLRPLVPDRIAQRTGEHITITPRDLARDPISEDEAAALEIPPFLRRTQ